MPRLLSRCMVWFVRTPLLYIHAASVEWIQGRPLGPIASLGLATTRETGGTRDARGLRDDPVGSNGIHCIRLADEKRRDTHRGRGSTSTPSRRWRRGGRASPPPARAGPPTSPSPETRATNKDTTHHITTGPPSSSASRPVVFPASPEPALAPPSRGTSWAEDTPHNISPGSWASGST